MTTHFGRPALLQIPDARRASPSSSSSPSSSPLTLLSSDSFDQRSKTSQFTDITLVDSVDSIFGNEPKFHPVPRFPDLVAWDGLTDEQWKLHSLVYKAERAIEEAEKGILTDLDEDFFRDDIWYDDLYGSDEGFDAVAAVRTRLVKGEQTIMTRRALQIIDGRSEIAPTWIAGDDEHSMDVEADVADVEDIEDYAEDFELSDEVLEIPATPNQSSTPDIDSVLEESREPDSLFNETFPSPPFSYATGIFPPLTPLIRPVDVIWGRPWFSSPDTRVSTPNFFSMMSPLVLNNPAFTSSFRNVDPTYSSPIVSISSFLFSSRFPLPTSLLDENLDIATIAGSLRHSGNGDVLPRVKIDSRQELSLGLGLVGVPTPMTQGAGAWTRTDQESSTSPISRAVPLLSESPQCEFQKSHLDRHDGMETVTSGPLYDVPVPAFEPAQSPWDVLVEDLGQSVVPYVPTTLGSTIVYTGLANNLGFDGGTTVTAGSSHPAASTSFTTSTYDASEAGKKVKGLGLRLPMGLKQRVSRCSSGKNTGIPTSEACQDLANLAAPVMETNSNSLRGFRGHMLSPIAEEDSQPVPCVIPEARPIPSRKKPRARNFFKRIIKFLF